MRKSITSGLRIVPICSTNSEQIQSLVEALIPVIKAGTAAFGYLRQRIFASSGASLSGEEISSINICFSPFFWNCAHQVSAAFLVALAIWSFDI